MKLRLISPLSVLIIFLSLNSCRSGLSEKENLAIENDVFSKTFWFDSEKPGSIKTSINLKPDQEEIFTEKGTPFFEFVVNNQIVSSNDPFWVFEKHSTREMENGGTEHTLVFKGADNVVDGLNVTLFQQIFPGSTLMRERLELGSEGSVFRLNKTNGKLHFKFPAYSIQNKKNKPAGLTEIRIATWEKKPITFGDQNKGNHMYYPDIIEYENGDANQTLKGPVSIISNANLSWFTAYEHASQDNLNGLFQKEKVGKGNLINDAMQGTKGVFNFSIREEDFKFIGISTQSSDETIDVSVDILRGGYLDGEIIDSEHPYSTVWTATGFYPGNDLEDGKAMLRNYLFNQICEKPVSRVPEFYYNTWGMQREARSVPVRDVLTYDRVFEEIEYAAELGVDIFVLDDGWSNAHGEWFPNQKKFPDGLAPIKKRLEKHGIKIGLWYSPMGIDSTASRYSEYPEWVIKDSEESTVLAQWNHPVFDFVSGFFDVFIDDCKKMIDEGCRFMKWDAINTFYSSLPDLHHGSANYSKEELRARYEYLLPIYVVRAMEVLTDYEPELIIEVDLTEARRVMVGLAPLSQGKLFWMNNGASWYNDYTTFRTKSMRTIANEFAGIVPLELFTYANYPQNVEGSMKYNVHNSILAGHGFWGNLRLMTSAERKWVGNQVRLSKKVLPYLVDVNPKVVGEVGDSPEIYTIVNEEKGAGQVIVFSEKPCKTDHIVEIDSEKVLAVLNNPYVIDDNQLNIPIHFSKNESSEAVFILPNENSNISILSSTSAITDAVVEKEQLTYSLSEPGSQIIQWNKSYGKPTVESSKEIEFELSEKNNLFIIEVESKNENSEIIVKNSTK
jgi:hypothetical protein